uniref:TctD-like protein n=1 Tax=Alsidium seaforthii TaxID=2007182 RepID=A0A1Z1MDJ4_9FLOR|nr:hypothetical protein [Bryothamnion seaforthii]ARW64033.1 hypothetical protein [Bryothamnion seaforthii]
MKQTKKILLVDDDNNLRGLVSSYLRAEGFFIGAVDSVHSALVVLKADCPDLIISDIMIKDLDGYDFIKLLKLDKMFIHIPVIFLTAKGLTADRIKGYNLGCHAYITKPFNPEELLAIINNIFYNIGLIQQKYLDPVKIKVFNSSLLNSLTPREKRIMNLVIKGYMNKEIALSLNISLRNVEKYISRLLNKTNSRNRIELIRSIFNFD